MRTNLLDVANSVPLYGIFYNYLLHLTIYLWVDSPTQ